MIETILIAGCGNFGSWWAAGCERHSEVVSITIYDPATNNIELICERIKILRNDEATKRKSILYIKNMESLASRYDLIVVSCNSKERLSLFEALKAKTSSSTWVLEKVLASNSNDIHRMLILSEDMDVYVNHSRRMQPLWQLFNIYRHDFAKINMIDQSLGMWELASNSFHFAEVISWSFNTRIGKCDIIKSSWRESRTRKGYYDFDGSMEFRYENGLVHNLSQDLCSNSNLFEFVSIDSEGKKEVCMSLDEGLGYIQIDKNKKIKIEFIAWSKLVCTFLDSIVKGEASLPRIETVYESNLEILQVLEKDFKNTYSSIKEFKIS